MSIVDIQQIVHVGVEVLIGVATILGILLGKQHVAAQQVQAAASKARELETIGDNLLRAVAFKNSVEPQDIQLHAPAVNGKSVVETLSDSKKVKTDIAERILLSIQQRLAP